MGCKMMIPCEACSRGQAPSITDRDKPPSLSGGVFHRLGPGQLACQSRVAVVSDPPHQRQRCAAVAIVTNSVTVLQAPVGGGMTPWCPICQMLEFGEGACVLLVYMPHLPLVIRGTEQTWYLCADIPCLSIHTPPFPVAPLVTAV